MPTEILKEKIRYNYHGLSPDHGNTVAAWTLVLVVIFGSLVTAIGFCIPQQFLLWAGVFVILVGLISGLVLKRMGYGTAGTEEFEPEKY